MRTLLAVSPHLDDAVFSAGATLWTAARRGWRVIIATVFAGNVAHPSGFALACQLDKGLGPDVDYMALRRQEDHEACSILGAEHRHLPLLEAPHRGYGDAKALFGPVRNDDPAHDDVGQLLAALIKELRPDYVLGPLGIGGHVDHLVVRAALTRTGQIIPCSLWEDWPYLERTSARDRRFARAEAMSSLARTAKLRACEAYRTQLGFQFGGSKKLREAVSKQTAEYLHPLRQAH